MKIDGKSYIKKEKKRKEISKPKCSTRGIDREKVKFFVIYWSIFGDGESNGSFVLKMKICKYF